MLLTTAFCLLIRSFILAYHSGIQKTDFSINFLNLMIMFVGVNHHDRLILSV